MRININKQHVVPRAAHRRFPQVAGFLFLLGLIHAPLPSHADPPQEWDWSSGLPIVIEHSIDYGNDIMLGMAATVDVQSDATLHLSGNITGSGRAYGLIKEGHGRLTLSGNNDELRRNSVLREGTLHLASSTAAGSPYQSLVAHAGTTLSFAPDIVVGNTLSLNANPHSPAGPGQNPAALQWRVDQGSASFIGSVIGDLPIVKQGFGTLHLANPAGMPNGRLDIAEGAVQLDGHFTGAIMVLKNSQLSGKGETGSLRVAAGATLAPHNTFAVTRDAVFEQDSNFHVRTWAHGTNDSIHAKGTVDLDGHVLVLPQGDAALW